MSVISYYSGFDLGQIAVDDYVKIVSDCLSDIGSFSVHFQGITASSSSIMIQGFLMNDALEKLRDLLRRRFKNSALEQSID